MKNKYEVLGIVGEGAYGIVYKCLNRETNKYVAVKKFKETQDKLVQKTMKRELAMLQMLHHENIVEFQESFTSKGNFFLVFEYVEKNLLEVLEESPNGLSPKLIRSFIYQMCKGVSYLHKNNMIHRDVKPENLLIDEKLNLKLCDFGFARKVKLNKYNNHENTMTDYVATRWYRSPELLLSGGVYGPEVDYWAIGCIMGELADGNAMFPGEDEVDQLDCIIKILGNLPENLVNMYYENPIYNGKQLFKTKKPETLEKRYLGILSPTAIDFMKGLLELDPNKRLNGDNVFKHKYFSIFMKDNNNNNNKINNNSNNNNVSIKVEKLDEKILNNKINNNSNNADNKVNNIKNNIESNNNEVTNNRNNNSHSQNKEVKNIPIIKNFINKDETNSIKSEKDKKIDNAYTYRNNNNNINNITQKLINKNLTNQKPQKEPEIKQINASPPKVINNTTNINIINYNCYNNNPNKSPNIQIPKKIFDLAKNPKNQDLLENTLAKFKKQKQIINNNKLTIFNDNESFYGNKNVFTIKKKVNPFTKSMINFNSIKVNKYNIINNNNKPSKKSSSLKKIYFENHINNNNNIDLSQKIIQPMNIISLSQGKINNKNNSVEKNTIKGANNTFYNYNKLNNSNNINNSTINYTNNNTSNNLASLINKAYSTNGFKSFFSNKDNKYNYNINTNYIKEESNKYPLYKNQLNEKSIIDEKDELDMSTDNANTMNKKNYQKKNNKKMLLIPFGSDNINIYNKKSFGYGTFYNKNFSFGKKKKTGEKKYKNNKLPPVLYRSINNATQYNFFGNNKNNKYINNNSFYMGGTKGFNPKNYNYNSK